MGLPTMTTKKKNHSALGLKKGTVRLVPFNPEWQKLFELEKQIILSRLGNKVVAIEHIGSTTIPDMPPKPVVHILVAIDSLAKIKEFFLLLEKVGYVHRELPFKAERIFFVKGPEENRRFHLSLVEHQSAEWTNSILFCEYLRNHKDVAKEYADLKMSLAEKYPNDRDSYTAAKQDFFKAIIQKAQKK